MRDLEKRILGEAAAWKRIQQPLEGLPGKQLLPGGLVRLAEIEKRIVDLLASRVVSLEGFQKLDRAGVVTALVGFLRAREVSLRPGTVDRMASSGTGCRQRDPSQHQKPRRRAPAHDRFPKATSGFH